MTCTMATTSTTTHSRLRSSVVLLGFIGTTLAVAALGSLATLDSVDGWYATADKPFFTPPDWLFGPVWTILYLAMAVAAWLLWRTRAGHDRTRALVAWWVQLVLNLAWTPVFFAAELLWPALAVIIALDVAVALTIWRAWRLDRTAAVLLVPYLAWTVFATALNTGVAALN